jgi:hypothetical protein
MVARYGMPGMCDPEARPVGYGMIGWREGAIVSDGRQSVAIQITPFPTGRIGSALSQAFHAWLPSFRPSGTKVSLLMLTRMGGRRISWRFFMTMRAALTLTPSIPELILIHGTGH